MIESGGSGSNLEADHQNEIKQSALQTARDVVGFQPDNARTASRLGYLPLDVSAETDVEICDAVTIDGYEATVVRFVTETVYGDTKEKIVVGKGDGSSQIYDFDHQQGFRQVDIDPHGSVAQQGGSASKGEVVSKIHQDFATIKTVVSTFKK